MKTLPSIHANEEVSIQEAAEILKVSTKTLRRWEEQGLLIPTRTLGGHRRYKLFDLNQFEKPVRKFAVTQSISPNVSKIVISSQKLLSQSSQPDREHIRRDFRLGQFNHRVNQPSQKIEPKIPARTFKATQEDFFNESEKIQFTFPGLTFISRKFAFALATLILLVTLGNGFSKLPQISVKTLGVFLAGYDQKKLAEITPKDLPAVLADTTFTENIRFQVNTPAVFNGSVTVNENLTVTETIAVDTGTITTTSTTANLFAENATAINFATEATTLAIGGTTGLTTINNNLNVTGLANDIAGTLNLSGNTLSSSADLTIDPTGGGVKIGTGTPGSVDLTGDDLYVTGDFEVDGTIYGISANFSGTATISTLSVNSDSFTDLTGTGLQISSGSLQSTLGTTIDTSEITDGTIQEVDLEVTNSPSDDYLLSYDAATAGFTWITQSSARGIDVVQESDVTINANTATTLDFLGGDFDLSESPDSELNIQLAANLTSVTGVAGNFDVTGQLVVGTSDAVTITTAGEIQIPATQTLQIGSIELNDVGTSSTTTGATLVGVYGTNITNATSATNVQEALESLGSAIGAGGSSKWTQDTGFIYLTTLTNDVVIGGNTAATGSFYFDEDAGNLYLGTNSALNGTLTLYSSGAVTDPTIAADASGNLIVTTTTNNFTTTTTGINSTAIGATTPAAGTFTNLASTGTSSLGNGAGDTVTIAVLTTSGPVITTAAGVLSSEAQLAVARGGTNASSVGSAGSLAYSTGSAYAFSAVGSSGQAVLSGAAGAPTFTTGTLTLAGNFATSGANALTLTTSGTTTATFPSGTITLADLESIQTFSGAKTFTTDTNLTYSGTENLAITSDLAGDVDVISLIGTPSGTAGTTSGLAISQADSANSNGLDSGLFINNADTNLALTDAILITNTGGGGYTNLLNTPSIDISGTGAISGATGISSSGTISFTGLTTNGPVYTSGGNGTLNSESQLAIARGGTNSTATPTAGGISYGTGTAYALSLAGTSGQCLTSAGSGTPVWADCDSAATTPFTTSSGVITKTTINDYLSLRFGDAAETQLEIQNTTTSTIPTADAMAIDLTGGTTGIVTDGVDALYIAAELGASGGTSTRSGLHLNIDPVGTPTSNDTYYAINIDALSASFDSTDAAINIGANWDNFLNTPTIDISGAGAISGATGISSSGTITLSGLTASRAVFTNGSSALTSSATSLVLLNSITDEVGSGSLVFATGPTISDPTLSGTITTALTGSRFVTSNASSQLATSGASADLLATLTDATGTGVAVFGTSPALTTPSIAGSTLTGTHDLQGTLSDSTGNVTIADSTDFTLGATDKVLVDGSTTTNTGTAGILDINLSTTASQAGIDIAATSIADSAADTISGLKITGTVSTDTDAIYGIQITNLSGTPTSGNEYGFYQAGTNWDYGALFEDDIIITNQSDLRLGDSDGSNYLAFQSAATVGSNITWTFPSANGSTGQCLKTDGTSGTATLSWEDCLGGAGGGVTTVGSMTASSVFSGSSADDQWLGLGAAAGRIEFDITPTPDEVNILDAWVGIGNSAPTARLNITPSTAAALTIDQYSTSAGATGELRFMEGAASSTQYSGFKAPDSLTTSAIYTLPNHDTSTPAADMVLTWQSSNTLEWKSVAGVGAGGDITDVGNVTTGAAFNSSATANGKWLGIGASDGRITFADDTTDEFNILAANVGIGTETPTTQLNISGNFDLEGYGAIGNGSAITADESLIINRAFTAATGNSAYQLHLGGNITENTSGTHGTIAPLAIDAIILTDGGGTEVITNLASLYIAGAPTAGTTPANGPYAIFADAGNVRFDGQIIAGSTLVTLTLATGFIDADAITLTTSGGAGAAFSSSGLEVASDGLTLLKGCTNNQVLKWDDTTDVRWECADDTSGATGIINIEEEDVSTSATASTLDFAGADFDVADDPGDSEQRISTDYTNFGNRLATLNIGDGSTNTRIDIGGVDTDTGHTINIATQNTTADTLLIGNNNAGTTVAITGGDDWNISATGILTLSASAAQTTAIVATDTDYTNALDVGDNTITGAGYLITSTASGLTLNSTSADLALQTTTSGNISLTPGGVGDIVNTIDADSNAQFNHTVASDITLNTVDVNSTNTSAASTGTLNLLAVRNLNEAGATGTPDSLVYLTNLDADETVTNGLFIEMATTGSTLSRGINITQSAGTLTDAIFQTGTVTNILNTDSIDISGSGAITGATGISSSGTITFSGLSTGVVINTSGTLSSEAQLATARGGLGANVTAVGAGEILYSTATTTYDSLVAGSLNQILISGGSAAPSWSNIASLLTQGTGITITGTTNTTITSTLGTSVDLTSEVTGVLPIANGGTNKALTLAAGAVVYSDADSFELTAAGTTGQCLISNGTSAPSWTSCDSAATTPFTTSSGVITKTTINDYLSLRFGDAAETQLEIQNTTTSTIPTADAMAIDLTGGTTGIVTDGLDGLYIAAEFGNGTTNTNSGLRINIDPVNTPSGDEVFYGINIEGLAAGTSATETALVIGSNWDTVLDSANLDISGAGAITGATGITSSGTITLSGLTASRAVFTGTSSELTSSAASSVLVDSITDETGSGLLVFATAPTVTTLTVSSGGAAITGNSTVTGTLTTTGNINANGGLDVDDAFVIADGGALTTSEAATFNGTTTFNGVSTFNTDTDFTLAATENIAITSDLAGTVNALSFIGTPSSTAGTTRGLFIQQANHASNTNGLDDAILIDNADADLALTDAVEITDSGGAGYTNFLNTPSIDITGAGAITGATGFNGLVVTANDGIITTGTWNGTTIAVANGGTGATTLTSNGVLYGNGTSAIGATTAGTNGQLLLGNTSAAPAFATMSGDATITAAGALTIASNAVALGDDTTGNYIATIASGNGVTVSGSGSETAAATVQLGSLTANWSQTGAFDIVLNNASSELGIRSSDDAAFFGYLDVGTLTADKTYVLPSFTGSSTNICLETGNCSGLGGSISGSGTSGEVSFFTGTSAIGSENMFEWDSTNDVLSLGTGSVAADTSALLDLYGESEYMVLRPADVSTDGDTNNSAILRLRGTYDSDVAVGPVTSSNFNFDIRNIMTAAGASPASRLDFLNNSGAQILSLSSAGVVTVPDAGLLDLSNILHNDAAVQGLKLPQNTTLTNMSTDEGYLAWDTDDNILYAYNGSSWQNVGGASTTLKNAYDNDVDGSDATISLLAADDSIVFTNPTSAGTDSAFILHLNQQNTTAGVSALDITQASNAFDAVNITANSIDEENVIDISATGLATGNAINVALTEATLTTGLYFRAYDNTVAATVFSVGEDGNTTITGAEGSTMFTLTAGDAVISDGSLLITDDDDAISLGVTNNTATTIGAGVNTAGIVDFSSSTLTTGNLLNLEANALTSGIALNVGSTSTSTTAITSGMLGYYNWSPSGSTNIVKSGDLFRINIGQYGDVTNLFNVTDQGSSLFRVSEAQIESAIPHAFTAPGDVSFSYDAIFTNQTASKIEAYGPFTIEAGESFESNNLTLKTYNSGDVVVDMGLGGSLDISTLAGVRTASAIDINENNTTGTVASLTWDSAETRGGFMDLNLTGALATEHFIDLTTSAAFTSNLIDVNVGAAAATGDIINVSLGSTSLDGGAFVIADAGGARTDALIDITTANTGSASDNAAIFQINTSGTLNSLANIIDLNITGNAASNAIDLTYATGVATGNAIDLNMGTNVAGDALNINAAATTGDSIDITPGTARTSGAGLKITDGSLAAAVTGDLIQLDITGTSDTNTLDFDISGGSAVSGNQLDITYSSAAHTGNAIDLNMGTNVAGNALDIATAATTGNAIDITTSGIFTNELIDINLGAQASTGDVINIDMGSTAVAAQAFVMSSSAAATVNLVDLSASAITSGDILNISSTSTALTSGNLFSSSLLANSAFTGALNLFEFDPTSSTTATGDILRISLASDGNVANLFNIQDGGSSIFKVSESIITSALPHEFTAAGDATFAYDINLTNQTSSTIESNGPFTIAAGEPSENNNLTLKTYGTGAIIMDGKFSLNSQETLPADDTTPSVAAGSHFLENNTTNTVVTNFDNGTVGQIIIIEITDTDFDVTCGTNIICGFTNPLTTAAGDELTFIFDGTTWNMISYMNVGTAGGNDIAEYFVSNEVLESGTIVSVNAATPVTVQKALSVDGQRTIGVVSTDPGQTLGEYSENSYPIALAGRVPVKINPNSAAIQNGDFIGASVTAGLGQKAQSGYYIGRALENWQPNTGKDTITIFIDNGFYLGNIAQNGEFNNQPPALDTLVAPEEPVTNTAQIEQLALQMIEHEDRLSALESATASMSAQLTQLAQISEASQSAQLLSLLDQALNVLGSATASAVLQEDLTVLGETTLSKVFITDELRVGLLKFDDIDSSIESIAQPLKLQPSALEGIDILDGAIVIDNQGNIVSTKELTVRKLNIGIDPMDSVIATPSASIGEGILKKNTLTVTIPTTSVTENSKVFVTPRTSTGGQSLIIDEIIPGESFSVRIEQTYLQNIKFDWWIVDKVASN